MRSLIPILLLAVVMAPLFAEEAPVQGGINPQNASNSNKQPSVSEEGVIYRWMDSEGTIHYGDEPPEGVEAERVDMNAEAISVKKGEHVYTWTDNEGNIHYGDQPPADSAAKQVDMESTPTSTIRDTMVRPGERQLLRQSTP
jgi:hypothetical protein